MRSAALAALRLAAVAIPFALSAVSAGCQKPKAEVCPSGRLCPPGARCAAAEDRCIFTDCGNGLPDPGEQCDDGNLVDGDGCTSVCRSEGCGDGTRQPTEECEDGNLVPGDGCDEFCRPEYCGNGRVDVGEGCDPAFELGVSVVGTLGVPGDRYHATTTSPSCNADCTPSRCGDGKLNTKALEQCDDGAGNGNGADCKTDCTLAWCGDGLVDASYASTRHEACDAGPLNTSASSCPYGDAICTVCSTGCAILNLTGPFCGDGAVNGPAGAEQCDATASFLCGTCGAPGGVDPAACHSALVHHATGTITVQANGGGGTSTNLGDGDRVLLHDGLSPTTIAVRYVDPPSDPCPVDTCFTRDDVGHPADPALVASVVAARINGLDAARGIGLRASRPGDPTVIVVENYVAGLRGNVLLQSSGAPFSIVGMSGGVGCPAGAFCAVDADCVTTVAGAHGTCLGGLCQPRRRRRRQRPGRRRCRVRGGRGRMDVE